MKEAEFGSPLGVPGTLGIAEDWSDPVYIAARADYEFIWFLQNLRAQTIKIQRQEASDLTTVAGSVQSAYNSFSTWWDAYLVDKATEYIPSLIEWSPVISAIATGGSSEVLAILLQGALQIAMKQGQEKAKQDEQDMQEVADSGLDTLHISIRNDPIDWHEERWTAGQEE